MSEACFPILPEPFPALPASVHNRTCRVTGVFGSVSAEACLLVLPEPFLGQLVVDPPQLCLLARPLLRLGRGPLGCI